MNNDDKKNGSSSALNAVISNDPSQQLCPSCWSRNWPHFSYHHHDALPQHYKDSLPKEQTIHTNSQIWTCRYCCKCTGAVAATCSTCTFSSASKVDASNPLGTITSATNTIRSFTSRLKDLSLKISQDVTLVSGQSVTLRDIVLHCRDSPPSQFASAAAMSARKEIEPLASEVEQEMSDMAQIFMADVAPAMAKAASICQETPCGGALWELESEGKLNDGNVQEEFAGSDTPCGRLEAASQEFVELTNATREEIALGARAALLLRMSQEHNAPLVEVRKTKEGKEAMARRFAREVVSTPWLRPKEEYEQFKKTRKE